VRCAKSIRRLRRGHEGDITVSSQFVGASNWSLRWKRPEQRNGGPGRANGVRGATAGTVEVPAITVRATTEVSIHWIDVRVPTGELH
jgi:hypothetical protein